MTNCHSRLSQDSTFSILSAVSIRERLKHRLFAKQHKQIVSESAYLEACSKVSRVLDNTYMRLAKCFLPLLPDKKLINNLQTIAQWEQNQHYDARIIPEHPKHMKTLKLLWPGWTPSSGYEVQYDGHADGKKKKKTITPLGRLYGDTLQSVLKFMEATELAACILVSRSWMAVGKRRSVWVGKVLQVADMIIPGMNELYIAPWASVALRYVENVVVVSSRPNNVHSLRDNINYSINYSNTDCYNQLLAALSRNAIPNIQRVCMLDCAATKLVVSLAGNSHVKEVIVGDSVGNRSFHNRVSLLKSMPNLRVARVTTFHDLNNMWSVGANHREFCISLDENRSLHHLVVSIENSDNQVLRLKQLYNVVSNHPSLKTLELQIYGESSAAGTIATILEHCVIICANLELLHIKQIVRIGYADRQDDRGTMFHLVNIRKALLDTVLRAESNMRVQIELVASKLAIKRYRKMLRELSAGAAELAKDRVWVRAIKPNIAKRDTLLHLI